MRHNPIIDDDEQSEDNPLSLLTNLFDVAMVFAVALMVAMVTHFDMAEMFSKEDFTIVKNPGADNMQIITKENGQIKKYSSSDSENPSQGSKGRRVGSAYELENGEIIYIPE